jgi:hypothetical protein
MRKSEITRRVALFAAVAALAAGATLDEAEAIFFRKAGNTVQVLTTLTTNTIQNNSGSASPSDTYVSWGQLLKPGDVASGNSIVGVIGGSQVVTQCDQIVTNTADGSWGFASLLCRTTSLATGNTSIAVSSLNVPPNNGASRTLLDVQGYNCSVVGTNVTNYGGGLDGSGTWTALVNDAIALGGANVQAIKSGPICNSWLFICPMKSAGVTHPLLRAQVIVEMYTKADGTADSPRVIPSIVNGAMASTVQTSLASQALAVGTTSSTAITNSGSLALTVSAGLTNIWVGQSVNIVLSASNYMQGTVASYSGTTLTVTLQSKSGVGTGTSWYILPAPSTFTLNAASYYNSGSNLIRAISGTISVAQNSGFYILGSTAKPDWIDGRASMNMVQVPTYLLQSNLVPSYNTALTMPVANASYVPATYSPMISGFVGSLTDARGGSGYTSGNAGILSEAKFITMQTNSSGYREDIGLHPSWAVRWFINQGANYAQTVEARSLCAIHMTTNWLNPVTWRVPTLNNGSDGAGTPYTSLGTVFSTTWQGQAGLSTQISNDISFGLPGNSGGTFGGTNAVYGAAGAYSMVDMEHYPSLNLMAYIMTGDWHHMMMQLNSATQAIFTRNPTTGRNIDKTIGGVNQKFWAVVIGNGGNVRVDAWGKREALYAWRFLPANAPEKQYFKDIVDASFNAMKWYFHDYYPSVANLAPMFPSMGMLWYPLIPAGGSYVSGQLHTFMQAYEMYVIALGKKMMENAANVNWVADYVMSNYAGRRAAMNGNDMYVETYAVGGFYKTETAHDAIGSFAEFGYFLIDGSVDSNNYDTLNFTASSATIAVQMFNGSTYNNNSQPFFKLQNGQAVRLTQEQPNSSGGSSGPTPPPEFTLGTTYYVVNSSWGTVYTANGNGIQLASAAVNTFQLAATVGGTPIVPSTSVQGVNLVMASPAWAPFAEFQSGGGWYGPGSYGNSWVAAMAISTWAGIAGAAAEYTAASGVVVTYNSAASNPPANDPNISYLTAV